MKLCDISSFYSDQGGGVRTYHRQKLAFFVAHPEHSYVLLVAGPRNEVREVPGGRIYTVRGLPVSHGGTYRQITDVLQVRRILRDERPDVIEVGSAYLDCWLAAASGIDWNPVVVGFYHADFPDSYMAPAVKRFPRAFGRPFVRFWHNYVRFTYQRFDATCVTSRYIEGKLRSYGVENTVLLPLGVDAELFHPRNRDEELRRQLGVGPGEKLLLYVGRFGTEKGIEVLIEALPRLAGMAGVHVVLVGIGPLEQELRARAGSCPRQHVLGYVSEPAELARLYASADLFLAPGPFETFGLSVLEAMASGLPVVAAGSGGAAELARQTTAGLTFRPGDADDFMRQVCLALCNDLRGLGRLARELAAGRYSWDRTFGSMVEAYEGLIDGNRSAVGGAPRRDPGLRGGGPEGREHPARVGHPDARPGGHSESPRPLAAP